jgi:hypothetical protein
MCTALRREHDFCKRSDPQAGFLANKLGRATGTCSKNPIFTRKNKDFVVYMKMMSVAAMQKYAPRWGESKICGIAPRIASKTCFADPMFYGV